MSIATESAKIAAYAKSALAAADLTARVETNPLTVSPEVIIDGQAAYDTDGVDRIVLAMVTL